jgi:transcriptional regulator GlxA family with amidase domain
VHRVLFVLFDDLQSLDLTGPLEAFAGADQAAGGGCYELTTASLDGAPVRTTSGLRITPDRALAGAPAPDTLLVPGGEGTRTPDPRLIDWLRAHGPPAGRVVSVCSGAFLLAAAGLLDGRRATTHWQRCGDFARVFPQVQVDPDRIFVRDGNVWTSAGITAGIDLALALIGEDLGEALARAVAQQLVVYHRRPGGQSQFSALIEMGGHGGRFAALLDWMRERLAEPLGVDRLADQAAMSPRHFARAFAAETGMTPARAVERLRLETARDRVEASAEPIDVVARQAGFGDPERMRRAFIRAFGQPPQALRRAARA